MSPRATLAMFALLAGGLAVSPSAAAQDTAELTGTYVRYVAVSANGVMVANDAPDGRACMPSCHCDAAGTSCVEGRGMRYTEDGDPTHVTCDAWYPRALETFTVVATAEDGSFVSAHQSFDAAALERLEGPVAVDRTIHWAGKILDGSGAEVMRLDLDWSYEQDDRIVRLAATITSQGSPLHDVYFLRNADPNFVGLCPDTGTGNASTTNDVVRQPPDAGSDALVTASAGGFVLGIGAHDDRARASVGGRENADPISTWTSPRDPGGVLANSAIDLVFREPSLASGDATRFEMLYVWGTSETDVEQRFDTSSGISTCLGVADGIGCSTVAGAPGTCWRSQCCTGCWDPIAARCQPGTSGASCGVAGALCVSCDDHVDCTSDVCGLGVCSSPPAPVGEPCEDGSFCTVGDTCDGRAHCVAGTPNPCDDGASCTTDRCDEPSRACAHDLSGGCLVGGECVADGAHPAAYPCLVCDPSQRDDDWSTAPASTPCGGPRCSAGVSFEGGTCDAAGACVSPRPSACASGRCLADGSACEPPCTDGSCPAGERCGPERHCVSLGEDGDACASAGECTSGACIDGVCCEASCDGLCAACNLPGHLGQCTPLPASTDPHAECPGTAACDGHGGCAAAPDAGPRDGGIDGALDAGSSPPSTPRDCACHVAGRRDSGAPTCLVATLVLLAISWRRRGVLRPLGMGLLGLGLLFPSDASATLLTGSLGFDWDVDDGIGGSGGIGSGTASAYDGAYALQVASRGYAVPPGGPVGLSAGGRQVDLPPVPVGTTGLTMERHVYVPDDAAWARFVDVVRNPTGSAIDATVAISSDLGSDGATALISTSSGDVTLDTTDTWFVTDDADFSGTPSLAHVFRGAGGAVGVVTIVLAVDQTFWAYGVTVPAHGAVALMHFAVQATSRANARSTAMALSALGPETQPGAEDWASLIVNWDVPWTGPCEGVAEGGACTSWSGAPGACRLGACCAGCWDGSTCQAGTSANACGLAGASCTSCTDASACTDDRCTAGACAFPPSSVATHCDDGHYCTGGDHCDGAGACVGGASGACDDAISCTLDTCDEATRSCTHDWNTGCRIGGECVATGDHHVAYPCLVCDPIRDASDWSPEPVGATCGADRCIDGHVFSAGTCDDAGTCSALAPITCTTLTCAADGLACEPPCTAASCAPGTRCGPSHLCVPSRALGEPCASADVCESGTCADGVCCDGPCDGTCEACDLSGRQGTCRAITTGTDPADECPGELTCDGRRACTSPPPDAGPVDASIARPDAGADGGTASPAPSSCSCTLPGRGSGPVELAVLALVAVFVRASRRAW